MESEFQDMDDRKAWAQSYQAIGSASIRYPFNDAKKRENKEFNRYQDVSPYDHSRIKLKRSSIDYINACLVKASDANRAYILTQGPLKNTAGHFWLMVWEQNCKAVLMLNRIIEKNIVKCHQYWPTGSNNFKDITFNDVGLKVKFVSKKEATNYIVSELELIDLESEESRKILHFHYTTWPDFGVPQSPSTFLNFLFAVREINVLNTDSQPAVIHCSAGIGRSGTFCLVDSCLVMCEKSDSILEKGKINQVLLDMRTCRMGLIQTPEQLRFSYLSIIEGAKRLLSSRRVDTENNLTSKSIENGASDEDSQSCAENTRNHVVNNLKVNSDCNGVIPVSSSRQLADSVSKKQIFVNDSHSSDDLNQLSNSSNTDEPEISLPLGNSNEEDETYSSTTANLNPSQEPLSESNVRKRKRQERDNRINDKIKEIKNKQKNTEIWQKRRRLLFHPVSIGIVALFTAGVIIYKLM